MSGRRLWALVVGATAAALLALSSPAVAGAGEPRPATPSAASSTYVAVGDSIASGGGNEGSGWVNWSGVATGNATDGCDRSPVGYPMLVRTWLASQTANVGFADYACIGATTTDLYGSSPAARDGLLGASHDHGEVDQLTHLTTLSDASLVTVTIGANDVDFYGDALQCFDHRALCKVGSPDPWISRLRYKITALAPVLGAVYAQLRHLAPTATIDAVLYPSLFPPTNQLTATERGSGCAGFSGAIVRFLTAAQSALDAVVSAQATAAGFTVVDPNAGPTGFVGGGHTLCDRAPWLFGRQRTGSFHPNKLGQAALAKATVAANTPAQGAR